MSKNFNDFRALLTDGRIKKYIDGTADESGQLPQDSVVAISVMLDILEDYDKWHSQPD
ncbi:TPA: hypothetical protein ACGO3A_002046 [Streptococcus suis]